MEKEKFTGHWYQGSWQLVCGIIGFAIALSSIIGYWLRKDAKNHKVGKITRVPYKFPGEEELEEFQDNESAFPQARILCDPALNSEIMERSEESMNKLNTILKNAFKIDNIQKDLVPRNARVVSIAMDGFKHGKESYEFVKPRRHGSYEYQMFGNDCLQVTVFHDGARVWIAGFCIYINHPVSKHQSWQEDTIKRCLRENPIGVPLAPMRRRVVVSSQEVVPAENMKVKYCPKLQRNVMSFQGDHGTVVHEEFDVILERMTRVTCQSCSMGGVEEEQEEEKGTEDDPPPYESLLRNQSS